MSIFSGIGAATALAATRPTSASKAERKRLEAEHNAFVARRQEQLGELFLKETMITKSGYRFDITGKTLRTITGNERTELDDWTMIGRTKKYGGEKKGVMTAQRRKGREVYVAGTHVHTLGGAGRTGNGVYVFKEGCEYEETMEDGIKYHIKNGVDIIMGGVYINVIHGPMVRICGMTDGMHCGFWNQVNGVRVEMIIMFRIHAAWGFIGMAGVHMAVGVLWIDDFANRIERYSVLKDNRTSAIALLNGNPKDGYLRCES